MAPKQAESFRNILKSLFCFPLLLFHHIVYCVSEWRAETLLSLQTHHFVLEEPNRYEIRMDEVGHIFNTSYHIYYNSTKHEYFVDIDASLLLIFLECNKLDQSKFWGIGWFFFFLITIFIFTLNNS